MKTTHSVSCSICGEPKTSGEGWFLMTENQWTDRLKILAWNEALAEVPAVHAACGAAHVQELVVHWMAMGSLEFPFARRLGEREAMRKRPRSVGRERREPDTSGSHVIGELAVHRESLARVLRENPESLAGILEALLSALTNGRGAEVPKQEIEEEESELCVLA